MMKTNRHRLLLTRSSLIALITTLVIQATAYGHVKWFSGYTFLDQPLTVGEALTPLFFGLTLLSVVVIGSGVLFEKKLQDSRWYQRANAFLGLFKKNSTLIIRIATGAVLLLSWQANTLLMPDLPVDASWITWYELVLAILLVIPRTVPWAGAGLILLLGIGLLQFGAFHILDHTLFLGVGYFLLTSRVSSGMQKPNRYQVLYGTLGFTICWLAIEKIIYPQWGLAILEQNTQLALGFNHAFFLTSTAFVEFSLGFMLIIGLLSRPLAIIIPTVFLLTTLIFGKIEVIGHIMIYAILAVILLQPRDAYSGPRKFKRSTVRRLVHTTAQFAVLLLILISVYAAGAQTKYNAYLLLTTHEEQAIESVESASAPVLAMVIHKDHFTGWNLELVTENFQFTPDECGGPHMQGTGHAHLYINGQKSARIYSSWHHLPDMAPGKYTLEITLVTNDHRSYTLDGQPIGATYDLVVE